MSRPVVELKPVDEAAISYVVTHVRDADRVEFECVQGQSVEDEVRNALEQSESAQAFVCDGQVVALFGCIRYDDRIGVPWLISTHAVTRYRRQFLIQCKREVEQMRQHHHALINYTDARYTLALRWMLWMGFDQQEAVPYGVNGELFHPFTMRGSKWEQQRQEQQ